MVHNKKRDSSYNIVLQIQHKSLKDLQKPHIQLPMTTVYFVKPYIYCMDFFSVAHIGATVHVM